MYHFSYFKEPDKSRLLGFIKDHPFAFLTGSFLTGQQVATQLPVLMEEKDGELYLQGHFMRNTDHHKAFMENPNALLVFTGPSAYVSATWYTNPHMGSTWNYMSVHVRGDVQFMEDNQLMAFMQKLTLHFEKGNDTSPTYIDNLPDEYVSKMLRGIVGFEIKVKELENVFKLSQNRDEESYVNIMKQLEKEGGSSAAIAAEMRMRKEELFPAGVEWDAGKFES